MTISNANSTADLFALMHAAKEGLENQNTSSFEEAFEAQLQSEHARNLEEFGTESLRFATIDNSHASEANLRGGLKRNDPENETLSVALNLADNRKAEVFLEYTGIGVDPLLSGWVNVTTADGETQPWSGAMVTLYFNDKFYTTFPLQSDGEFAIKLDVTGRMGMEILSRMGDILLIDDIMINA